MKFPLGPAWLVALCFGVSLVLLFPGIMSYDSLYVYKQSQTLRLDDWHPPSYTLLIRYLRALWDSPGVVLSFNIVVFSIGSFLLAVLVYGRHKLLGYLVPFVVFLPFVLNFIGVLWKDTALAVCWWTASSIVIYLHFEKAAGRPLARVLLYVLVAFSLGLVSFGLLSRHNAIASAPFLFAAVGLSALRRSKYTRGSLAIVSAIACALTVLVAVGGSNVIDRFYGVTKTTPFSSLIVFDLAGITRNTGINAFPTEFSDLQIRAISDCYQLNDWNSYGDKCVFVPQALQDQKWWGTKRLTQHWLHQMLLNPLAYLKHRFEYYMFFLRIGYDRGYYIVHPGGIDENDLGLKHAENWAFRNFIEYVNWFQKWPVMKPWFWLVVGVFLLSVWTVRARRCSHAWLGVCISASSLIYILSYVPFGVAADFRYVYWSILGSISSLVLFIIRPVGRHDPSNPVMHRKDANVQHRLKSWGLGSIRGPRRF